ncbi:MAG: N-acetylneuraminate synthase [Phycisphaeraceae bacterium]
MRVLGLVTARGGSKGFPGKNLAALAGRPLVTWAHRLLSEIRRSMPELQLVLSTDDPTIAAAWPEADRPAHLRPAELSTDTASSIDVVLFELDRLAKAGKGCDAVLLIQPTSPLLNAQDVLDAWAMFDAGHVCVIGVAPAPHPVQWNLFRDDEGVLTWALPRGSDAQRQKQQPAYLPVGYYLATGGFLREHRSFYVPGVTRSIIVPASRAVDIDTPVDIDIAAAQLLHARTNRTMTIGDRKIGEGQRVFVIAEAGVNHNGDERVAHELIEAAADAGADAVKFQTFKASELVTASAPKAAYQVASTGAQESQRDMLAKLELPAEAFAALKAHAEKLGLVFLSSPFDAPSAKLLIELGVKAFKLGSGELTNTPMLAQLAATGRPLILSTGMASLEEVEDASDVLAAHGNSPVAWLHCVSTYPAPADQSNLRAMDSLRLVVDGPVGLSDHTMGWEVALAAVARGASIIEKHLTLSRDMKGPDHAASLEPVELKQMIEQLRRVESALGDGVKRAMACELDTRKVARKSLVAARDLLAGTVLKAGDLACKRPGTGISPAMLDSIVGRTLKSPLATQERLTFAHLQ